jgi:uncharacterized protein YyaL (SSP411 family)
VLYADSRAAAFHPAIAGMPSRDGETTVYVCENFTCQQPVSREEELRALLR